jgi:hypothetical protein
MNDPGGKDYGTPGVYNTLLVADSDSECPLFHDAFLTFLEMYV